MSESVTWQSFVARLMPEWQARVFGLQAAIGYQFRDSGLLLAAFIHSSAAKAEPLKAYETPWNERLEFLGDAVLDLAISDRLFNDLPEASEGRMSKLRAALVNRARLDQVSREWQFADLLLVGKGVGRKDEAELSGMAADACEAVIGAVYLDGGWHAARQVVERLFASIFEDEIENLDGGDHKTALQELTQKYYQAPPVYHVRMLADNAHEVDGRSEFFAEVWISDEKLASGSGRTKKKATQSAATEALSKLRARFENSKVRNACED